MILLQASLFLVYYNIVDAIRRRLKSLRSHRNRHKKEPAGAPDEREEKDSKGKGEV
jgi:hypothetical protein